MNIGSAWEDTNWSGACDAEAKLAKPTLVIAGTDYNNYIPHANALVIAEKIPGAWLIKDAGHAVMDQYPAEISKILNTFLSTAGQNNVTGGNMTGGNMTGGNVTEGNTTGSISAAT